MKTTSRKLNDLRKPYFKLIIVMGLITWMKDYQKIIDATQILNLDTIPWICHPKDPTEKIPDSVTCSLPIFQRLPIHPDKPTHEK